MPLLNTNCLTTPFYLAAKAIYHLPPVSTIRHVFCGSPAYNSLAFRVRDAAILSVSTYLTLQAMALSDPTTKALSDLTAEPALSTSKTALLTTILALGITNIPAHIWQGPAGQNQAYTTFARRLLQTALIIGTTYSAYELSPKITPYIQQAIDTTTCAYEQIGEPILNKASNWGQTAAPHVKKVLNRIASTVDSMPNLSQPVIEKLSAFKEKVTPDITLLTNWSTWTLENVITPTVQKIGNVAYSIGETIYKKIVG